MCQSPMEQLAAYVTAFAIGVVCTISIQKWMQAVAAKARNERAA